MRYNKKGFATTELIMFIFFSMIAVLIIGIFLFISNTIYDHLAIDLNVGQVNLKNVTNDTFGQVNTGFTNNADKISYFLIFGLVLSMFGTGYLLKGKYPKLLILADIMLLIGFMIVAVYVSYSYRIFVNNSDILSTTFTDDLSISSNIILNSPIYITIIWVIIVILTYSSIPKPEEETEFESL